MLWFSSRCRRILWGEGHSVAGWGAGGSVELLLRGPKSVRSGNGLPLIAPRCLLLVLVSMPLQIINRCCFGFLRKWRHITVRTFTLLIYLFWCSLPCTRVKEFTSQAFRHPEITPSPNLSPILVSCATIRNSVPLKSFQRHWSLFSTYWRYTNKIIIIIKRVLKFFVNN